MPQYTPSPTFPYLEKTKDPAEFFKSWITSPEYRRRKIETDYPQYAEYSPVTGDEIDDPYKGPLIDRAMRNNFLKLEQIQRPGAITYDPTRRSEYFVEGEANVNPKDFAGDINTVKSHEIAHAIDTNIDDLSNRERELLTSATEGWFNKRVPRTLSPELYQKVQLAQHLEKPTELKADLNALRFLMYDKDIYDIRKGEKFTKEHLEKAKEKLKGNQSLDRTLMVTGDDNLINLMNIIAKRDEELTPIAMNGASMPGSVGFTYARVAGAAPSKGKYAKKTMASAQNGQEMRFYQNGLDWKPKSMQEGGQEDGKIYEGMELPEVVVEGKDERIKEAMSQGIKKFYGHIGELMGAPQKEAMQLITGKEQTPSEAWGFQKPGGWLDSYSSFGKNAFNFGLDSLIDPVNAVPGVGMIDDIGRLSLKGIGQNLGKGIGRRAISQAPSPQMMADDVLASATPNASTVSSQPLPYTELDHPHMDLLQELKQKTIDRIDTPEGRRRLQYMINKNFGRDHKSWGKPVESWGEFFLHGLKSGELSGFKKLKPDDIIEEIRNLKFIKSNDPFIDADNAFAGRRGGDGGYGPGSVAAMYMGENQIPGDIRRVFDHEMGHIFQRNRRRTNLDDKLSELELKKQPSSVPDSPLSEEQLEDVDFSKSNQQWGYGFYPARDYFLTGSGGMEKLPFAAEVRQSLLRRGKIKDYYDEITPQMIEDHYDLYNKTGGNKSILRLYEIMEKTPKNFKILSETLNKLPAVTLPIAGGAAATISALQNQQPVQKQRNGGITKDNLGYWNPDNWGKPVEIGSNNITMEGVYEPLLGISDTGDTKLMQPGKNYKFNGKKVTEFPVAQTGKDTPAQQEVSRQDYLSKFNMYDDVLKSKNYTTPYYKDNNIDTSEGDMNCINGVCYMVSNIAGVKFDKGQTKDTYTGNATFADNAMDEGYYRSNPEKEGFGVGDIFQYARKKGNTFSRFPGEVDFRNENDLYPNHAVLIVNEFVKDGKKYFKVANNAGGDKVEIEDVSESELMNRYKKGYKTFDGGITYRYDPDKVTSIKKENQDKINVLKGKNPYSGQYSKFDTSNLTFFNNKVDGLNVKNELAPDKNLQRYADVYKTVYSDLGKGSNMPIDSFNKLIMNQIGIAGQETKFGELASNPKDIVPDSLLPYARRAREIYDYNFGEEDNWKKDYWNKNADNVQKEFSSYQDFVKSLDSEDSDYSPYRTPRSIGEFQQKDLSERGNFYKYDLDSFEGQVKSSLALAVDNYHKLKAKYPDLSEDQIIDLTTLMHNAPGKALEPRFVNYYLKRNDVDYIDKVKGFAPKSFGKDQSKNEKIEWKTEKISPEEAKSIADYVRSLPKTKRNGGDVGINQLDAQPMKKLNQLLNFTNNPDKDNWLDKYN
jgi:hypothetical protein